MSESKHTPLPWECDSVALRNDGETSYIIYSANDEFFGALEGQRVIFDTLNADSVFTPEDCAANIAFALRACNSHYELLEACWAVVGTWATGDWAAASRKCAEAISNVEKKGE